LNFLGRNFQLWGTSINDNAHTAAVRFAKSRNTEKMTKSAAHDVEKIQTGIFILHGAKSDRQA
jgi:hypothetical protein